MSDAACLPPGRLEGAAQRCRCTVAEAWCNSGLSVVSGGCAHTRPRSGGVLIGAAEWVVGQAPMQSALKSCPRQGNGRCSRSELNKAQDEALAGNARRRPTTSSRSRSGPERLPS
jgi:hypothetical protein